MAAGIARSTASALLIAVAGVLVPVSVVTVWVQDIVLDSSRYVATVSPLATDKAIQDAAVYRVRQALVIRRNSKEVTADIAAWMRDKGLPPNAVDVVQGLSPKLDAAVDRTVDVLATRFVHSEDFAAVWTGANRTAHAAVVHALTGKGHGAVGFSDDTVTLDVGRAVARVKKQLENAGMVPASQIPKVDRQMVLFRSEHLPALRSGVRLLDMAGTWLPTVTAVVASAGVLLARRRRRALAVTAGGTALACLAFVVALAVARTVYLDHLPRRVLSPAAGAAVFDTLLRFPWATLRTALALSGVIAVGAYLAGPGRLPGALRGAVDRAADAAARWSGARGGRVGGWFAAHRRWSALTALLLTAVTFTVWERPTVRTVLLLALTLSAALGVIALLAATGRGEEAPRPAARSRRKRRAGAAASGRRRP